jgi:hypothetical protein
LVEVDDEVIGSLRHIHYIINIGLNIVPYLFGKAMLDSPLIGGTRVFKFEGHYGVGVGTKRHDKRSLDLVFLL